MQAVGTKNRTSLHSIDGSAFKTRGSLSIGQRGSLSFGISTTIKEKVDEALEGATVTVQHTHTHSYCIERDLKEYADTRLWNRSIAFGLTSVVLAAIIVIIAIVHYNCETYWGRQYYEVYSSPFLTKEEKEKLSRDVHTIAILPNEFDKDPKRVKERIKKSKAILKERKKEARRRQK